VTSFIDDPSQLHTYFSMRGPAHPFVDEDGVGSNLIGDDHRLKSVRLLREAEDRYFLLSLTNPFKKISIEKKQHFSSNST
jgi:hypothetical protein